jgi:DNA polymerase, archaea type
VLDLSLSYAQPIQLFGDDQTTGIVAVERAGESAVRVYRRVNGFVREEREELRPWLLTAEPDASQLVGMDAIEELEGDRVFRCRLVFSSWSAWGDAYRFARDNGIPIVTFPSPVEQYLVNSGRGLFRGMQFDELKRVQLDIETLGLDPYQDAAAIVMVTLAVNGSQPVVLRGDELAEPELIDALESWLQDIDPDVIEGHNLYNFDLPFLIERARRYGRALRWGRDGSPVRQGGEQRFKAGARTIPYVAAYVYGRHIIDTYQQLQRFDAAGQLDTYALKPAMRALGLDRSDRTHVDGWDIAEAWRERRDDLVRYAIDDVLDVSVLSELALPTEFYQTQLLPRSLQSVATGGPGEKINDIFVRAYVSAKQSVPAPSPPQDYPGGYAEVLRTGRFAPIVKTDVESLYPSIMLANQIAPQSDQLGIFLPALSLLTERRLAAKREEQQTTGKEQARWRGIQSSLKVLINSFYGYLGYSRGYFNDYSAATRVTTIGQEIVRTIVDELEKYGAAPIEVDTDGVFFQPPPTVRTEDDELRLVERLSAALPSGIRLAHDGRFAGMLSLKLKNYALLGYDGRVYLKGSSLRSRREEAFLRRFVQDAVAHLLDPDGHGNIRDFYLSAAERIQQGLLTPAELSRTETITDQTFRSESNRRLAEAVEGERIGERVLVYQRVDGTIGRTVQYAGDEDRNYLLRRLRDMTERFRPLFDSNEEFEYTFPVITVRTDLNALRSTKQITQLGLFPI